MFQLGFHEMKDRNIALNGQYLNEKKTGLI